MSLFTWFFFIGNHTHFLSLSSFSFSSVSFPRTCASHNPLSGQDGRASFPGRMEATHSSLRVCVCVCNLWSHKVPFGLFPFNSRGRDGRFPSHDEAMEIDWMGSCHFCFALLARTTYHLLATASNLRRSPPTSSQWPPTLKRWPLTYYLSLLFCLRKLPTTY